jgi:hypothetical protein
VKSGDVDVATNAAGAIARIAERRAIQASAIPAVACPMLDDARATVRANALAALAAARIRCGDGHTERKLLADDSADLVRGGAARALGVAPTADDKVVLDRCAATDRSAEVGHLCRPKAPDAGASPPRTQAVTVYVIGEGPSTSPKAHAPYLLQYEDGILRAGSADRRGAVFDPAAPAGEIALRRAP